MQKSRTMLDDVYTSQGGEKFFFHSLWLGIWLRNILSNPLCVADDEGDNTIFHFCSDVYYFIIFAGY